MSDNKNAFSELIITIIIPSIILMKLSDDSRLGALPALLLALSIPIAYALYDWFAKGKRSYMALIGVVSVLLTGGIGVLQIDAKWLAVKEAAIPALIGIVVIISVYLGKSPLTALLRSTSIINFDLIDERLLEQNQQALFYKKIQVANYCLAGTFFFSSIMNFILTKSIVVSESGTSAFNEELGKLTLFSYPVIAIPSLIMLLLLMRYFFKTVNRLTGLRFSDVIKEG